MKVPEPWLPKSLLALRAYERGWLGGDLVAGLTVGLVALPLAMAFAISSGMPPEAGIYCAVVAGFLISALGGSMVQIGGPTGAFVVVVASIVERHGPDGLFMCTLLAGLMLLGLGLSGLGATVKFIPRSVVIGFTNGIAVLIASTQIKDFFGLQTPRHGGEFLARMGALAASWQTAALVPSLLAIGSLLAIVGIGRLTKRVPGTVVAMLGGTLLAFTLKLPVETIATRFGEIPSGLPKLHVPAFRGDLILPLLSPAITVAMLGAIESLLSAVVADRMSGDRHNPNVELAAQGVANVVSPLFGGLPATGAIARTATNVRSGAKTPIAGMVHALVLLAILLFAAPAAKQIPLCVLAAILMVVAYNMGEWKEIPGVLRQGKAESAVWAITFALTVFADLTVAVEAGMILAALLYIRRVTTTTTIEQVTDEYVEAGREHSLQLHRLPIGAVAYRIQGPLLFGAADKLEVIERQIPDLPPVVLLRLRNMTAIDATCLHAMEHLMQRLRATGRHLVLCGAKGQPENLFRQSGFADRLGRENLLPNLASAVQRARELLRGEQDEGR